MCRLKELSWRRFVFLIGCAKLELTICLADVTYAYTNRTFDLKLSREGFEWMKAQVASRNSPQIVILWPLRWPGAVRIGTTSPLAGGAWVPAKGLSLSPQNLSRLPREVQLQTGWSTCTRLYAWHRRFRPYGEWRERKLRDGRICMRCLNLVIPRLTVVRRVMWE